MSEVPKIIPPKVPFVDPRTGTIAREWFHWLLKLVAKNNDNELVEAFDAAIGAAATAQVRNDVQGARLIAQVQPPFPQVSKRDLQDAQLFSTPVPTTVTKRDLQDVVLAELPKQDLELAKRVESLAIQLAQAQALVTHLKSQLNDVQLQSVINPVQQSYWTQGQVSVVSPTAPDRTIKVSIAGTSYYIHAKTTND